MNQHDTKQVIAALAIGMWMSIPMGEALATHEPEKRCNDAMLHGTYGIAFRGTRPSAPGGATESVIGVVIRQYDGRGGVTQVDNVKGSISGHVPDRFGSGTYQVREDCSVVVDFQPGPGISIQELSLIIGNGHELRGISILPPTLMVTNVQLRM